MEPLITTIIVILLLIAYTTLTIFNIYKRRTGSIDWSTLKSTITAYIMSFIPTYK